LRIFLCPFFQEINLVILRYKI